MSFSPAFCISFRRDFLISNWKRSPRSSSCRAFLFFSLVDTQDTIPVASNPQRVSVAKYLGMTRSMRTRKGVSGLNRYFLVIEAGMLARHRSPLRGLDARFSGPMSVGRSLMRRQSPRLVWYDMSVIEVGSGRSSSCRAATARRGY